MKLNFSSGYENLINKMTELVTVQVNVNQLLLEEGGRDNATVETRTMSAIVNKTLEQACKWVRHNCDRQRSTFSQCCFNIL